MKDNWIKQISGIIDRYKKHGIWRRIVSVLGCLVVFCTVYALILPAITLEKTPQCGMEEHTHTEECYQAHEHTEVCPEGCDLTVEGEPVCGLPEHTHTDACYESAEPVLVEQTIEQNTEHAVIRVSGLIPEGASVQAVPVEVQDKVQEGQVLMAFDLTILLPDGTVYEPEEGTLSVEISAPELKENECEIYYIPESGTPEEMPAANQGESVSFETPHFSTYAVVKAAPPLNEVIESGTIEGTALTWKVTQNVNGEKTLTVSGNGAIPDYPKVGQAPWYLKYNKTKMHIVIEDGVTVVGSNAFAYMDIASISIGSTVTDIRSGAFKEATSHMTTLRIPGNVKSIGQGAFKMDGSLQELILEEGVTHIGPNAFSNAEGTIKIPASVNDIQVLAFRKASAYEVDPNSKDYTSKNGILYYKNGKVLADVPKQMVMDTYTVDPGVNTVIKGALQELQGIRKVVIPDNVKTLPQEALFMDSAISEVEFGNNVTISKTTNMFSGATNIKKIQWPESTPVPMENTFGTGTFKSLETFQFPSGTTTIGKMGDKVSFPALSEVTFNAANANITATTPVFPDAQYILTVGTNTKEIPQGFPQLLGNAKKLQFQGENTITIPAGTFENAPEPFKGISGKIYVDKNGVVYRIDEKAKTASLISIPSGLTSVTIPETVKSGSASYQVAEVKKHALADASALTDLIFVKGKNITLAPQALADCPTLKKVNNKTTVSDAKKEFKSTDPTSFENTGLTGSSVPGPDSAAMEGKKNLTLKKKGASEMNIEVESSGKTMVWKDGINGKGGYVLKTGDSFQINGSVNNTEGNTNNKYRVYFQKLDPDCNVNIKAGETYIFKTEGSEYTVKCFAVDGNPDILYVEFSPDTGQTVSGTVTGIYPSPESSGGRLRVWGAIVPSDTADGTNVDPKGEYIEAEWVTEPDPFELKKTAKSDEMSIRIYDEENKQVIRPENPLIWQIDLNRQLDTTSPYGKDYATAVEFTDVMTLPKGINWDPRLVEAVKNGTARVSGNSISVDGVSMIEFHAPGKNVSTPKLVWDEKTQNIKAVWKLVNDNPKAEISIPSMQLVLTPQSVTADKKEFTTKDPKTVVNNVTADVNYTYSESKQLTAEASTRVKGGNSNLRLEKTIDRPAKYFGEDLVYNIKLHNRGTADWTGQKEHYQIHDSLEKSQYIKPENMEKMFKEAEASNAELTILIEGASVAEWKKAIGIDGSTICDKTPQNSDMGVETTITVTSLGAKGYQVEVADGNKYTGTTIEDALKKAGYAITDTASYTCDWKLKDKSLTVKSGEERNFKIYGTVKDTFQMIPTDWERKYGGKDVVIKNTAFLQGRNNKDVFENIGKFNSSTNTTVLPEAAVYKNVSRNGTSLNSRFTVGDKDVLDYDLTFDHLGNGTYQSLPMVDDLGGDQSLLVPVKENPGLRFKGLKQHVVDGKDYYILKEGTYNKVKIGTDASGKLLTADTVTVTKTEKGLHTQIKWYYPELPGNQYRISVSYKTLVDKSLTPGDEWSIKNKVWMNDKPGSRIYDTILGEGTLIDFDKFIVKEKGNMPAEDVLISDSAINAGEKVTYRLELRNPNPAKEHVVKGSKIADALPRTYNIFTWDPSMITDFKYEFSDPAGKAENLDQWYLGTSYNGIIDENRQYILWNDTTKITLPPDGTIYMYFTLTYPDNTAENGELWNQYVSTVGSRYIDNTFYLQRFPSTVTHALKQTGQVLLQKGVSAMARREKFNYTKYTFTGDSILYYNTRDSKYRTILYYVTLYNGGDNRLYLNPLHDRLPKGFTYKGIYRKFTNQHAYQTESIDTVVEQNLVTLPEGAKCKIASVKGSAGTDPQDLTFEISAPAGDSPDNLKFDETKGQYYLEKGEAIVFGYACDIGTANEVERQEIATNAIGMYYSDHLKSGVETVSKARGPVVGRDPVGYTYSDNNDGTRQVVSSTQVENDYGLPNTYGPGNWLVSDVSVRTGGIIPGVVKYTQSHTNTEGKTTEYTNSVSGKDIVNWKIQLNNSGTLSLTDYTFTDIMPAPYVFTGEIRISLLDGSGNELVKPDNKDTGSVLVCRIINRQGNQIEIEEAKKTGGSAVKHTVTIGGGWVKLYGKETYIAIDKDSQNNEVLKLHFGAPPMAIPEGNGKLMVYVSGKNPTTTYENTSYTNQAFLTPNTQKFDSVSNGSRVPAGADGSKDMVTNSSPVTVAFGYATSSYKEVFEKQDPSNHAVSTDPGNNTIMLPQSDRVFTYKLWVNNDTSKAMTKLVMIDNLPEQGDTSPFNTETKRNSEFKVKLAEDPGFKVSIVTGEKETVLDPSKYSIEYATTTNFGNPGSPDWKGEKTGTTAVWTENPADARAFRFIFKDAEGTLIPSGAKICISFDAVIPNASEVQPEQIAWNNFGYHYGLKSIDLELEAMPLAVGIKIPAIPILSKKLVGTDGKPANAEKDTIFEFEISNADGASKTVELKVPAGSSSAELLLDSKVMGPDWKWKNGTYYTIKERTPSGDASAWVFKEWIGCTDNNDGSGSFLYRNNQKVTLECVNGAQNWSLTLNKKDRKTKDQLDGAVFALYSPSETDKMTDETYNSLTEKPARTLSKDNKIWYLKDVQTTVNGKISWSVLNQDQYYILEVKAPKGYLINKEPVSVMRSAAGKETVIDILNTTGFVLPHTGGNGISGYTWCGLLLILSALFAALYMRQHRERRIRK